MSENYWLRTLRLALVSRVMNPEGSIPSGRHVVIVTISRLNVNQNIVVGVKGIEPWSDAYQATALPLSYTPRVFCPLVLVPIQVEFNHPWFRSSPSWKLLHLQEGVSTLGQRAPRAYEAQRSMVRTFKPVAHGSLLSYHREIEAPSVQHHASTAFGLSFLQIYR